MEDVRKYREENLAKLCMDGFFHIWKRETAELARLFIDLGFKAIVTNVDSNSLNARFVGRMFDERFLSEIPLDVDPCGENGEFHSFVFDGPIFQKAVKFRTGKVVFRENRFYYCDLVPVDNRGF